MFGIAVSEFMKLLAKSQFPACPQPAPWMSCSGVMMKTELFQAVLLCLHLQVQIFIPFFFGLAQLMGNDWALNNRMVWTGRGLRGHLVLPGCLWQSFIL